MALRDAGGAEMPLVTESSMMTTSRNRQMRNPERPTSGQDAGSTALHYSPTARARVDGYVSLGVIASAGVVALGFAAADPLIGLAITILILKITWEAFRTVKADKHRTAT